MVLDHPELQVKMLEETRVSIVNTLGILVSNAKLVANGDNRAKDSLETAVPILMRSVNQVFTTPIVAQPQYIQFKVFLFFVF